jgi:hypothetical protein
MIDMSNQSNLKSSINHIISNKEQSDYLMNYYSHLKNKRKIKLKERGNFINNNRKLSQNFAARYQMIV